jgi:serine phosphatase RsbU (regulator of sigma subunit)
MQLYRTLKVLLRCAYLFLPVLSGIGIYAQTVEPIVQNYSEQQLGTRSALIWRAAQYENGLVYLANNDGVLVFDGHYWRLIPTPTAVRSLAVDANGKVWVGCISDFGSLEAKPGGLTYVSLKQFLPANSRKQYFGWVNEVIVLGSSIYFVADEFIFRARPQTDHKLFLHVYTPPKNATFAGGMRVGNQVWVYVNGETQAGLFQLNETGYQPLAVASQYTEFAVKRWQASGSTTWFVSENGKLWKTDGRSIEPVATTVSKIEDLSPLGTDRLAVATRSEGAAVLSTSGQVLQSLGKAFAGAGCYSILVDHQQGIWVGHGKGLSRFQALGSIQSFGGSIVGIGKINAIEVFNGAAHLATNTGVYRLEGGTLTPLATARDEAYALAAVGGRLLAVTLGGLKDLTGGTSASVPVAPADAQPLGLYPSAQDPNRVWVTTTAGCYGLTRADNGWSVLPEGPQLNRQANSVVENPDGSLWIGTDVKGVARWKPGTAAEFPDEDRLQGSVQVYRLSDGTVVFRHPGSGFYRFVGTAFQPLPNWNALTRSGNRFATLHIDRGGTAWLIGDQKTRTVTGVRLESTQADSVSAVRIFTETPTAVWSDGSTGWVGVYNRLFRLESLTALPTRPNIRPLIGQVTLATDSVAHVLVFGEDNHRFRFVQAESDALWFSYAFNRVRIQFAAPLFDFPAANQYRYRLEGGSHEWSEWSSSTEAEFANLWEGNYTFRVQARDAFGRQSGEALYRFSISPPLYRHLGAYALYGLIGVGLVFGVVGLNGKRLEDQNRKLEAIVTERTAELSAAKVQTEQLNQDLQSRNQLITEQNEDLRDSINYARRIQTAILPDLALVRTYLPGFGLFYQPKDIVSGDFYWFTYRPDTEVSIFAVVDCTGHGVPGAFMSVIGYNLLNRIVNELQIIDPAEILTQLDQAVRQALKQTGEPSTTAATTEDGMDLSLCVYHHPTRTLTYAGAHRPVYYLAATAPDLEIIEGARYSIGGSMVSGKVFTNHRLTVAPGDKLYLFSDGIVDQFGGPEDRKKKYTPKRLQATLLALRAQPAPTIAEGIATEIRDWMASTNQLDDLTFIAVDF